jgi:rod shape determining protein RodA
MKGLKKGIHDMNNEKYPQRIDYGVILSVLLLCIISVMSLYSTTVLIQGDPITMTIMQIVWYAAGVIAAAVIMMFDSEQLWKMTTYLYILGLIALLITVIFYDRSMWQRTGGKRWVRIPGINYTLQLSEFAKIPYILMLSKTVTRHNSQNVFRTYKSDFMLLGKIAVLALVPIALVLLQQDLGTALVYMAIAAGITFLSGVKWQILLPIFLVVSTVGLTLLWLAVYNQEILLSAGFRPYQFERVTTWLDPHSDTSRASYQVVQTFKAIGSGGVFGKGWGVSEVYVPVRESDMIFATIGENFGFAGGAFLIFIYFVLVYHMIKIVYDTKNEFYAYIATGVIMMIVFHVFENVGMNIGLLPMTGIPLPFVSQGGSALLGNMMGIGLIMSMRFHHKSYFFSGDGEEFHSGA